MPIWGSRDPTFREAEVTVGYLLFAALVVCPTFLPCWHLALKWWRRVAAKYAKGRPGDGERVALPTALAAFREWAAITRANEWCRVHVADRSAPAILFTDASGAGWGAITSFSDQLLGAPICQC